MTMLTTGELSKIASKGPYAGKKRTEIISLKIKNKQPFYIGSGSGTKFFAEKVDLKTSPIKLFYRNSNKKLIDISINIKILILEEAEAQVVDQKTPI